VDLNQASIFYVILAYCLLPAALPWMFVRLSRYIWSSYFVSSAILFGLPMALIATANMVSFYQYNALLIWLIGTVALFAMSAGYLSAKFAENRANTLTLRKIVEGRKT